MWWKLWYYCLLDWLVEAFESKPFHFFSPSFWFFVVRHTYVSQLRCAALHAHAHAHAGPRGSRESCSLFFSLSSKGFAVGFYRVLRSRWIGGVTGQSPALPVEGFLSGIGHVCFDWILAFLPRQWLDFLCLRGAGCCTTCNSASH